MANEIEEVVGGILGFVVLMTVGIVLIIFVGVFVLPVVALVIGLLYYFRNVLGPAQRRRESNAALSQLEAEANRITPPIDDLIERLKRAGITDVLALDVAFQLFQMEGLKPPERPAVLADSISVARHQEALQRYIENTRSDHYDRFASRLVSILSDYQGEVNGGGLFHCRRRRSRQEIEDLILRFVNDDGLFKKLTYIVNENYNAEDSVMPSDSKIENYAWAYLRNTPLLALEYVEQSISLEDRMYHTYLLGSSGSGKTNLIENIVAHDLASDEDCCVVVIDSQTQLTEKLSQVDIPDTLYVTPKWNLALNLFDVGYEDMRARGIEGETLINKTVGLLSFVMEGMMGAAFTPPQKTIFQYAIQLVISIKGGNISTFMDVLSDNGHKEYRRQIEQFDDNTQRFFEKDFGSDEYKRSREAIRRRLDGLLLNPTFRRLFSASENKIDMAHELATRRLILIDTNKPMLDDVGSSFFGRLFIAMIVRASHMRFASNHGQLRPVYLVVDEAHEYFDRSISDMLEQARKANIGLIVAHQSLSQAKGNREEGRSNIADPLMVNTATKIIWTAFRDDAARFAGSMQIKADEILNLPQFTFGMFSRKRGWTPIRGRPDALRRLPKRSDPHELQELMEANYGATEFVAEDPMTEERPRPRGPSMNSTTPPPRPPDDELPERDFI